MIVKNEENSLSKCLNSIKDIVSEIIVIDTGSTDKTKEIAISFGAKIYDFEWIDDFSAARNFAINKTTKEWIICHLDADEYIENPSEFASTLAQVDEKDNVAISISCKHGSLKFDRVLMLKKGAGNFQYRVHEALIYDFSKRLYLSQLIMVHDRGNKERDPDRNIKILKKAITTCYENEKPRYLFYYARECKDRENLDEALTYYEKYLTYSNWFPEELQAMMDMANIYHSKKEFNNSRKMLHKILTKEDKYREAYINLGILAYLEQDYKKCLNYMIIAKNTPLKNVLFHNSYKDTQLLQEYINYCKTKIHISDFF